MKNVQKLLPAILSLTLSCFAEEPTHFKQLLPLDAIFICETIEGLSIDSSGIFGSNLPGIVKRFPPQSQEIAITLDACGGGYNAELITYLKRESIPATLFISGTWITANPDAFLELTRDTLFEIENHGLAHRVPSVNGRSVYGIRPTRNAAEVVEEIEGGARFIKDQTGRRPLFFRPATGFMDETSLHIAEKLGMTVVDWDVASGDGVPFTPAKTIINQILTHVRPGSIVILHVNHPKWNEKAALEKAIPLLRLKGYRFVKLKDRLMPPIRISY